MKTTFCKRSKILSTNYNLKCPHSESNKNLFSWGHIRPKNFLVWSYIFVYFNIYKLHLVVKHPVLSKFLALLSLVAEQWVNFKNIFWLLLLFNIPCILHSLRTVRKNWRTKITLLEPRTRTAPAISCPRLKSLLF